MSQPQEHTTYDELPYTSYPFEISRPERIAANAKIFGLNPPKLETARILELGGASGQNVLRFAADYPKSKVVSVDLSSVQIADGQRYVDEMKLKNVDLKAMSIADIDESFGEFDYIICHGVFSWVPEFVREKILDICNKNLSENGIAYISYNTLPGWNMVNTVRDMMQFHGETFQATGDKVNQGMLFLKFVADSLKGNDTAYAQFLQSEAEQLKDKNVSYLRHEHFSEDNVAFYFHDFISMAQKHGLNYLADSHLSSMYLGNMPEKSREQLGTIQDIIRTEQYMDFIRNRRFRSTLLCKQSQELNRNVTFESLKDCYFMVPVKYDGDISKVAIKDGVEFTVEIGGNAVTSNAAVNTALFIAILENPEQYFSIQELSKMVQDKGIKHQLQQIEPVIYNSLQQLLFSGQAQASIAKTKGVYEVSAKPVASAVSRAQVKLNPNTQWVTGQNHNPIPVSTIYKELIKLLDGTRDHKQIAQEIEKVVIAGTLSLSIKDKAITDKAQIASIITENLPELLSKLANSHLLIK